MLKLAFNLGMKKELCQGYGIELTLEANHYQWEPMRSTLKLDGLERLTISEEVFDVLNKDETKNDEVIDEIPVFIQIIKNPLLLDKVYSLSDNEVEPLLVMAKKSNDKQNKIKDKACRLEYSSIKKVSNGTQNHLKNKLPAIQVLIFPAKKIILDEVIIQYFEDDFKINLNKDSILDELHRHFIQNNLPVAQNQNYTIFNDEGAVSFKINFISCFPTKNGFLDLKTKLILLKSEHNVITTPNSPLSSDTSFSNGHNVDWNSSLQFKPLDYLPLIKKNVVDISSKDKVQCFVKILPFYDILEKWLDATHLTHLDQHNIIFISLSTLKKLKVQSGEWVGVQGHHNKNLRWSRVVGIPSHWMEKYHASDEHIDEHIDGHKCMALIPPLLNYHLNDEHQDIQLKYIILVKMNYLMGPDGVELGPLLAQHITLTRIQTPISNQRSNQSMIHHKLMHYFKSKSRVLHLNDLIVISIDHGIIHLAPGLSDMLPIEDVESLNITNKQSESLAYFKVTKLQPYEAQSNNYPQGYLIDPLQTQTLQSGSSTCLLPPFMKRYFHGSQHAKQFEADLQFNDKMTQLTQLLASSLHPLSKKLKLHCSILVHGLRGIGKAQMIREVADSLGIHLFEINCYELIEESDTKTKENWKALFQMISNYSPCLLLLKHIDALAKKGASNDSSQEPWLSLMFHELLHQLLNKETSLHHYPTSIVATCESLDNFPTSLQSCFGHEIALEAPNEKSRLAILEGLCQTTPLAPDVVMDRIASETAALVAKDLSDLVERSAGLALKRIVELEGRFGHETVLRAGSQLYAEDLEVALNGSRAQYSDSIGAPKIPNVSWEDVGGLASVKGDILDTIQLPLQHPELFASGAKKRSGILLYGPPGTGKTLLAKAVATSCSLNFFSVKGPELLNMYIGESEANVRRVFQKARDANPCVIFFDELDSVAPKRGEQGDSGGVMDRIVSQLLAELDGMGNGEQSQVFVIGATNRPDLLDPALLRPGRFDKMLYLGVPQDHGSQLNILQALTRKFRLAPQLDLLKIAERCPFHFTGADFYALCSDAMLKAMTRCASAIDSKVEEYNRTHEKSISIAAYLDRVATLQDTQPLVEEQDFLLALDELKPSVTQAELDHYQLIRQRFSG